MSHPIAIPLSLVQPRSLEWLWKPYFPRGKLVLLDGDPGLGKSILTLDLAARVSRGAPWPGGAESGPPEAAIILNAEDAAADTIRPRAEAAGADLDRLLVLDRADGRPFRLPDDIPALRDAIARQPTALVVLDPFLAFLPPEIPAGADQCIRRVLFELADVAERTRATVVLVRHLTKRSSDPALYRGLGSIGMVGSVRSALLVARHPGDPSACVLAVSKSNFDGAPPALAYRIRPNASGQPVLDWLDPLALAADDVARPAPPRDRLKPRDHCMLWLSRELAAGPRLANELFEAARQAGIAERTLERAKRDLKVDTHRVRLKGRSVWYWFDPKLPWPKSAPFPEPFRLPDLPDL